MLRLDGVNSEITWEGIVACNRILIGLIRGRAVGFITTVSNGGFVLVHPVKNELLALHGMDVYVVLTCC
jgi:hypothetical protein